MIERPVSRKLWERSQKRIPGGVNSPVRAFRAVGGEPFFVARARGARIWDVDGNEYIDYVMSWGPLILGHAHPRVVEAVTAAARNGTSYGIPSPLEVRLAELVADRIPSVERVRMVNSGTEATMSAIRLARGATGRAKIVKFIGCYHGHVDSLLVQAGSGVATLATPDSAGVPASFTQETIAVGFNDLGAVRLAFDRFPGQIGAVIVEPVGGNAGVLLPAPGFLAGLRDITRQAGAVLIFDEVMTGFRVARGGAQELYGVRPDLTCLGKILGGGLPVGAFGGPAELMDQLAPLGPVYQAGTLSGNPLAMAAGIATLEALDAPGVYQEVERAAARLADGLEQAAAAHGIPHRLNRVGSMFSLFFTDQPVADFRSAAASDRARFARFFHGMLDRGVYLAPSPFEAGFVSLAHGPEEIDRTLAAAAASFAVEADRPA